MRLMTVIGQALVGAALLLSIASGTALADDRAAGMDDYIREAIKRWDVPGLAIAVVKDGEVVVARGFGVAEPGTDRAVTADTVLPIASCTKSFNAACIAMLVDEGKVQWDDPVRKHLPDFKVADPYVTENLTIRDILCHRTGLIRADLMGVSVASRAEIFQRLQYVEQAEPFRTKVTYNNVLTAVIGEIIHKKSGLSWREFLEQRVFKPLEMTSTWTDSSQVPAERMAIRQEYRNGKLHPVRLEPDLTPEAGGIYSSVNDMTKWLLLQLGEGEFNGQRLISQASMREMHAMHVAYPIKRPLGQERYYSKMAGEGLGWLIREYRGRKVVSHDGSSGAHVVFVPEEKLGIVVLTNRDWNSLCAMLWYDAIDAFIDSPQSAWSLNKSWEFWLPLDGRVWGDRDHREQLEQLTATRKKETQPSLPLGAYAGTYSSKLYADVVVTVVEGRLRLKFGPYSGPFEHWDTDSFYARDFVNSNIDWLVKFEVSNGKATGFEITHVGWKYLNERFVFRRAE